jgi:hypothetical protein
LFGLGASAPEGEQAQARGAPLARAVRHAEQAQFGRALEAFEQAERRQELTRQQLVRLYTERALVRFAMGARELMRADLRRLVAVEPQATLPPTAPPAVRRALDRAHKQRVELRLRAEAEPAEGSVRIRARVQGAPEGLIHRVRVWATTPRTDEWTHGDGGKLTVVVPPSDRVRWYVQAQGPGDVPLANSGTRQAPRRTRVGPLSGGVGAQDPAADAEQSSKKWWWVGAGSAVVAVAAAVTAAVLTTRPDSEGTSISGPTWAIRRH